MSYLRPINLLVFVVLIILLVATNLNEDIHFDGYYKRTEFILSQDQDTIKLTTSADFLSEEQKYTSIVKIIDVEKDTQYSTFTLDGDIYNKDGLLIARTNKIEEVEDVNRPVVFEASTSPIVTRIQKSFLGIDVYKDRVYERILVDSFLCYYDLDKHVVRCMEQ
ncbi:hypothetical protein ONE56_16260 [Vibrio mytili]|uniref:hypothetical protein n=1 Tax=Vibrio mytili TaxID=50718 RepID=UPI003C6FDCBF